MRNPDEWARAELLGVNNTPTGRRGGESDEDLGGGNLTQLFQTALSGVVFSIFRPPLTLSSLRAPRLGWGHSQVGVALAGI